MRQKFQDLLVLLKRDRRTQFFAILIVFGLMFLIFAEPKRPGQVQKRPSLTAGSGATTTDERYSDLVLRFNSQLESLSTAAHETSVRLDQSMQRSEEYEKRTAEIFRRILERIAETEAAVVNTSIGGQSPIDVGSGTGAPGAAGRAGANGAAGGVAGANAGNAAGRTGGMGGAGSGGSGSGSGGAFGPGGSAAGSGGAFGPGGGINPRTGAPYTMASAGYGQYDENGNPISEDGEPDAPEPFGFEDPQVVPPPAPLPKKVAVVGTGDSVRVRLLAGVNAPTDGTPYPVVFELSGEVAGPDGSSLPLGEARLVAAAQGSLTDSRALFRLSSLNIRLPNGRRKILDVDGWIVGEDGKRGMAGMLIDPLSEVIGGVAIGGAVDGLGQAISQQQIRSYRDAFGNRAEEVTGDVFKYAGGKALQQSSREWSSVIRERAQQLVPHVEVLSGREGTAVFSKSFIIPDLFETLEQGEEEGPFL